MSAQGIDFHIDNYVPNHGFEQHGISSPFGSMLYNLDDWKANGGSPDSHRPSITYNNEELPEVSLSYTYIKATNCQVPSSESVEFYGESITLKTGFRAYPGSNLF